jgi:ABC-type uncharacterized transport system auxiliary subunit
MRRTPLNMRYCAEAFMNRRFALGLLAVVILLSGCSSAAKSSAAIRHYAIEYASPAFKESGPVSESIRVETLSVVRNFSTTSMVYRSRPYVYNDDAYNRWKVKPSVMISDMLLRDMRSAGLFGGVYSDGDREGGDYALGGMIEEMYEQEERDASRAVLALNMTLLHTSRQNAGGRLVFQKSYRTAEVMERSDADSMARAMSRAMEALSRQIVLDTYTAIRRNGDTGKTVPSPHGLSHR